MDLANLPIGADQHTGRKLGRYEFICKLSGGGMSQIFLAFQRGLGGFRKLVVLKQILPDISGEEEFVRMFLDEAKITATLSHPNIAQVFDLDVQEGELFITMEFVAGATLVEVAKGCMAGRERIPVGFTAAAVRDTASALHYAHTLVDPTGRTPKIVHRDVAQKNIMVNYEGQTKLVDFGIAKQLDARVRTMVGKVKGTTGYMSPEQLLGHALDGRSDVFSLGVVLHECLTGMKLFFGRSDQEEIKATLYKKIEPPSAQNPEVPAEIDAVTLKALARKRDERFGSASEFAAAIEQAAGARLWRSQQSAEFMQRLFATRREQTQKFLQDIAADEPSSVLPSLAMLRKPDPPPADSAPPGSRPTPLPPPPELPDPAPAWAQQDRGDTLRLPLSAPEDPTMPAVSALSKNLSAGEPEPTTAPGRPNSLPPRYGELETRKNPAEVPLELRDKPLSTSERLGSALFGQGSHPHSAPALGTALGAESNDHTVLMPGIRSSDPFIELTRPARKRRRLQWRNVQPAPWMAIPAGLALLALVLIGWAVVRGGSEAPKETAKPAVALPDPAAAADAGFEEVDLSAIDLDPDSDPDPEPAAAAAKKNRKGAGPAKKKKPGTRH